MSRTLFSALIMVLPFLRSIEMEGIYPVCCENVSGNCRTACHKITLIDLATKPERHKLFTAHLEQHCEGTKYLRDFMRCFNNTTRELQRGSNWAGRECCVFARDPRCRVACIYAQSKHELEPVCWLSKETGLYDCFQSRDDATQCCNYVRSGNISSSCSTFCMDLLPAAIMPPEYTYGDLILLHPKCSDASEIVHCAWGLGKAPDHPLQCGDCCNASSNAACRSACQEVVKRDLAGIPAVEMLISSGCGPPDPLESFWICLLKSLDNEKSSSFIASKQPANPDSMKLHCCLKASSERCRTACFQVYNPTVPADHLDDLYWDCLEEDSEVALRTCLHDVSLPCQIGCSSMNFCSHLNDRAAQSFRSCDTVNDKKALHKFELWSKNKEITIFNHTRVNVNMGGMCSDVWRGLVCAHYIQPCDIVNWNTAPCRAHCISMVSRCVHEDAAGSASARAVCEHLFPLPPSPENHTVCPIIDVHTSYDQKIIILPIDSLTTPCQPNPCPPNMRCEVRRQNEKFADNTYDCVPGCTVFSEITGSAQFVSLESKIVIPYEGTGGRSCFIVCTCAADNMMTMCEDLGLCEIQEGCWSNTVYYEHGTSFQRSCSRCVCLAGELICSAGYCITEAQRDEERNALTGLPCSCPTNFNRVCGLNGKTYPTECSARCSGLSEYHFKGGICSIELVCPYNDCGPDRWCVERSEVCLDHQHKCQQHTCVDIKTSCLQQPMETCCDTAGDEHPNLCTLLLAGRRFRYMGKCLNGCSSQGQVCGHNSETFESECAALADRVGIDYQGRCDTVGGRVEKGLLNTCLIVEKRCPPKALTDCVSIVPPDACCSVCAGALRVLFSKRRLHRLAERRVLTITSRELITELQRLVQSSSCQVLGYLTMENDIVVLVQLLNLTGQVATLEEHTVCVREAERLHYLINSQNPVIVINARLWPLAASKIIHASPVPSHAASTVMFVFAQHISFVICCVYFISLW